MSQGETQILSSSASEKECFTSWRSKQKRPAKLVNERHGTVLWPVMRPVVVVVWRKAEENGREPHPTVTRNRRPHQHYSSTSKGCICMPRKMGPLEGSAAASKVLPKVMM